MRKVVWCLLLVAICMLLIIPGLTDTNLSLPESLTRIEESAFEGDNSITAVVIPESVQDIGRRAFADCGQLTTVRIESRTAEIDGSAFAGSPVAIMAYSGSTAETFALQHGIELTLIDSMDFNDAALALIMARGKPESAAHGELFASERLLVQMSGSTLPDISAYEPSRILSEGTGYFVVQFDDMDHASACHDYLRTAEGVEIVEPDRFMTVVASGGEVEAASLNENWENSDPMGMEAYAAYIREKYPNAGATVAVIDSGVAQHSALNGHILQGYDLTGQNNPRYDATGHGTSVAGCIVDAVYGANVKIIPIRVFGVDFVTTSMIRQAIKKAISCHPSVINISYGFDESGIITAMLQSNSIPVVVSAGNDGVSCDNLYPAKLSSVYTVSALGTTMTRWGDSNFGSSVDFCAPGENIAGYTSAGGTYNYYKGTSYAAPQISAAIALLAMDPEHGIGDMKNWCRDLGANGRDSYYGWGLPVMSMGTPKVAEIRIINEVPSVMQVGASSVLMYEVLPDHAEDKTVTITPSDPSVLNVTKTAEGVIRIVGLSQGESTVSIAANDGSGVKVTTNMIRVVQPVVNIGLFAATHEVNVAVEGETLGITANIQPTDATNKELEWTSSDETKATVAQNGVVTPIDVNDVDDEGNPIPVIIRAEAKDGYGAYAEFEVYVIRLIRPTAIGIEKDSSEMTVGQTMQLENIREPEDSVSTVTWYSTDNTIASVSAGGVVTAKKSGRVYIVVTSAVAPDIQASCELIITQPPTDLTLTVPQDATGYLDVGKFLQLSAAVVPAAADDPEVVWESNNPGVATVDKTGKVSAVAPGTVVITAKAHGAPGIRKIYTLTVRQLPVEIQITGESVSNGKTDVYKDTTKQLTATVLPANADNKAVTWSSSNTAIATVTQSGQVTGVGRGIAVITVTSSAVPTLKQTITVEVYPEWTNYDWTPIADVPDNAVITEQKWIYNELKSTDNASEDGWTQTGTHWEQTNETSYLRWVDFGPLTGFKKTDSLYTTYNKKPAREETATAKKEIGSTTTNGYIYWHWMYDCGGAGAGNRAIFYKEGTGSSTLTGNNYGYKYWGAFESTKTYSQIDAGKNWGQDDRYYLWYEVSDRTSYSQSQGSKYWYRTPINKTTYVHYKIKYDYKREVTVTTKPTASATVTNIREYAKYKIKNTSSVQYSDWVPESSVPAGAEIAETKWTYKETVTSNSSTMSGWTLESSDWLQTGTGSVRWANFAPLSGFNTSDSLYATYNKTAPTASETATTKRVINSTTNDGYIYWHWMYDCGGSGAGDRAIFYKKGTGSSTLTGNNFGYKYWGAFESSTAFNQIDAGKNWGQNDTYYLWYNVTNRTSYAQSQGSKYWYRIQIRKTVYTDYTRQYTHARTITTTTEPTAGNGISNIKKYVRFVVE